LRGRVLSHGCVAAEIRSKEPLQTREAVADGRVQLNLNDEDALTACSC